MTCKKLRQSLLIMSPITRCAATWPLELELKLFLSNNVRMSTVRDHNSNNCTHIGNVRCCTYMVNNDYDKFRSFSRLYMTVFRHRTCTCLHGRADRFLVLASDGRWQHSVTVLIIIRIWLRARYFFLSSTQPKPIDNKPIH